MTIELIHKEVEFNSILEYSAVIFNLTYLILLINEKKLCWYFGIMGSTISIWLFFRIGLYSESILYIYYVAVGIYGLYLWNKPGEKKLVITDLSFAQHVKWALTGILGGLLMGFLFSRYSDAKSAYLDAFTTSFSFMASYLEARKILGAWVLWILINGATIWLYQQRELDLYTLLTGLYFIASFLGYLKWKELMPSVIK